MDGVLTLGVVVEDEPGAIELMEGESTGCVPPDGEFSKGEIQAGFFQIKRKSSLIA